MARKSKSLPTPAELIPTKPRRGFAAMTPERQRELARKGGKSVPDSKRSFSRDPELASRAGRKGGLSVPLAHRNLHRHPELATEYGRKGGLASHDGGRKPKKA